MSQLEKVKRFHLFGILCKFHTSSATLGDTYNVFGDAIKPINNSKCLKKIHNYYIFLC